jgi:hypothetical protein
MKHIILSLITVLFFGCETPNIYQKLACGGTLPSGAVFNNGSTYKKHQEGNAETLSYSPSLGSCTFRCSDNYEWTNGSCVAQTNSISGSFIDAPVMGLTYKTSGGYEGVTGPIGDFLCNTGRRSIFILVLHFL